MKFPRWILCGKNDYRERSVHPDCLWMVYALPFPRLNIVNGSVVSAQFLESLTTVARIPSFEHLRNVVLTPSETNELALSIQKRRMKGGEFTVYVGRVRHHLRKGTSCTFHHEQWVMLGIVDETRSKWLCPLQRVSDLDAHVGSGICDAAQLKDAFKNLPAHGQLSNDRTMIYMADRNLQQLQLRANPDIVTHMWLSRNRLFYLPRCTSTMTGLRVLDISWNCFFDIPAAIRALPALEELKLCGNPLVKPIALYAVGEMQSLRRLDLSNCLLEAIPDELGSLRNLQHLHLHNNYLERLPDSFQHLTALRELSLNNNKLCSLPDAFVRLTGLKWLALNGNRLQALPREFGNLCKLQRLSLHSNALTALPMSLARCTDIRAVSLFHNNLTAIPGELLRNWTSCTTLSLMNNHIHVLPDEIRYMVRLEELWITNNPIASLPDGLSACVALKRLWMENTLVTKIPDLKSLEAVYATGCPSQQKF